MGDNATVSASAHFHNLQLQKSPSRVFGQNSGNSADISKASFEMGISNLKSALRKERETIKELRAKYSVTDDGAEALTPFGEIPRARRGGPAPDVRGGQLPRRGTPHRGTE